MKRKKQFRVGQTVCSIYEPGRTFTLDRSAMPERIFREKGSNRWWTKSELQRPGAPENPATSSRLNGKEQMRGTHPKCAEDVSGGLHSEVKAAVLGLPRRSCLECRAIFRPARPWQKFDSADCRRAYWKKVNAVSRGVDVKAFDRGNMGEACQKRTVQPMGPMRQFVTPGSAG